MGMMYFGFPTVTIPPTVPASIEMQNNAIVSQSVNPFTHQTQQFSWGVTYKDISVSLPPLTPVQAAPWLGFFDQLNGTANVFCFSPSVCLDFPYELSIASGYCVSSSGTSLNLASYGISATDGFYDGQTISIVEGTGAGQSGTVTAYDGSSRTVTLDSAFGTAVDSTSVFTIPRYWRMKSSASKWSIKTGKLYYFTAEFTEVIV